MRKRKRNWLEPEPITREWLEYVIHDELGYHKTLDQFVGKFHETEARLKVDIKRYLDELPPEDLPKTRGDEAFRWMDERMAELCERMGVNRYRMPLYVSDRATDATPSAKNDPSREEDPSL